MAFWLFVALNAVLLIRPEEILPDIAGLRLYLVTITLCVVTAAPRIIEILQWDSLTARPLTLCVLGLWQATIVSQLARGQLGLALDFGTEFGKVVIYYLILISVIDTPTRLRTFLGCLVGYVAVFAVIGLLHFHGVVEVPTIKTLERVEHGESGEATVTPQLQSTGIYSDPNDLCLILVTGSTCALARSTTSAGVLARFAWLTPIWLFGYGVILTKSRGGLLGLLAAVVTWAWGRYGWKRTFPTLILILPLVPLFLSGRQSNFSLGREDTAHSRVALWSDGLVTMMRNPITGIGAGEYADQIGMVAHNSFVHAYVELGLLGGSLFLGAFLLGGMGLWRIRPPSPLLASLRVFVLALLVGYAGGALSLSRCYVVPTYMVLGLADAYLQMAGHYATPGAHVRTGDIARFFAVGTLGWIGLRVTTNLLLAIAG
ncbi:O-antigen ligase family protein [bacterium]|nr:O-antigen ligase family protein [bacterium]